MSKIAISPNVSGTGTFTIAAPDSNTDRTLTLPDASGSVVLNEGSGTFKIDASGNVGIGVTPSAWASPFSALQVGAGAVLFGRSDGTVTQTQLGNNLYYNGTNDVFMGSGYAARYFQNNGVHRWETSSTSGTAGNAITFTQAMTLDASGQLFLPNGNIYGKSDNTGAMSVYGGGAYNSGAGITLTGQSNSTANAIIFTRGNYTESARIDASGNLLVGTTSFDANWAPKLQVSSSAADGTGGVVIESYRPSLIFKDASGSAVRQHIVADDSSLLFGSGDASFTERARIDSSGNLLVGTSSTFDNVSFLKAQVFGGVATKIPGTTATSQMSFFNDNGRVGFIGTSGTATSYNTSSDYRLKENVVPLIGAASRIAQIPVHQFNFIADPDTTVDGFLAHEVQTVIPEAVHGTKDEVDADGNPVYQGIDQSKLVPLLTAALQEALADIATLKAEVAALKGASA